MTKIRKISAQLFKSWEVEAVEAMLIVPRFIVERGTRQVQRYASYGEVEEMSFIRGVTGSDRRIEMWWITDEAHFEADFGPEGSEEFALEVLEGLNLACRDVRLEIEFVGQLPWEIQDMDFRHVYVTDFLPLWKEMYEAEHVADKTAEDLLAVPTTEDENLVGYGVWQSE